MVLSAAVPEKGTGRYFSGAWSSNEQKVCGAGGIVNQRQRLLLEGTVSVSQEIHRPKGPEEKAVNPEVTAVAQRVLTVT